MSTYVHKSHNVTVLLYHLVFPAKYRRAVIDVSVDQALREVCLEIETRYQLKFLEIGTDRDHVHGPGSRALSGAVGTDLQRDQAGDDHQESDRAGDLPALSRRKEEAMGRRVLER